MDNYRVFEKLQQSNISFSHYVFVSASSLLLEYHPMNVVDWSSSSMYHSLDVINTFIRFDFPTSPVYVEKFVLRSSINRDPYNWVLEGSTDSVNFITLYENIAKKLCDEWIKFDSVNTGCKSIETKTYNLSEPGTFVSLRIRIFDSGSANNQYFLILSGVDFIGRININGSDSKCNNFQFHSIMVHVFAFIFQIFIIC